MSNKSNSRKLKIIGIFLISLTSGVLSVILTYKVYDSDSNSRNNPHIDNSRDQFVLLFDPILLNSKSSQVGVVPDSLMNFIRTKPIELIDNKTLRPTALHVSEKRSFFVFGANHSHKNKKYSMVLGILLQASSVDGKILEQIEAKYSNGEGVSIVNSFVLNVPMEVERDLHKIDNKWRDLSFGFLVIEGSCDRLISKDQSIKLQSDNYRDQLYITDKLVRDVIVSYAGTGQTSDSNGPNNSVEE